MNHIRISFDDGDPWHLSVVPLFAFVVGVASFCLGATLFALNGLDWDNAFGIAIGALTGSAGGVGMIREHLSQAAAFDTARENAEREAGA